MKMESSSISILSLVVFLLFTVSQAREILVGGSENSWKVPESSNDTLSHWSATNRFKVGDVLVWKYDQKIDSVLQVTKEDFDSCNTLKPIKEHKDGNTKVELVESGPHFFISGAPGNCGKGEKMMVVVISPNHPPPKSGDRTVSPAKSPSHSPGSAPAPAPAKSSAVGMVGRGFWSAAGLGVVMGLALV
ncbi:PREDICTED: early nodulin-like protein 1 [Tarenaya hassleriana]|uniref:early nodulin-like protein 1 n=1 Tax=Tarenaya hassleriana TaxID=28532 RepID=UPI00053C9E92|nr:PREDICTED: early nodulin-like protein 1 [Tarenaya hassleriana]